MKRIGKVIYKFLGTLGIVKYSGKKNIYGLDPLIISGLVITTTILLAQLLRKIVKLILREHFIGELLLEIIAAAELCACCFELCIVASNFGLATYAVFLFALTVWWSLTWENATACPYYPIEEVLEGSRDRIKAILVIASQILGGVIVYRYVQTIWAIELAETHIGLAHKECTADLQVPMSYGAGIEGMATFFCRVVSRILHEANIRYAHMCDAFFGTLLVVAAFHSSGGYFNPVLASSLQFGCTGSTILEHIVVYWIGCIAGSIASIYFFKIPLVQSYIDNLGEKTKQD